MMIKAHYSPKDILDTLKTVLKNASKNRDHNMRIFSVSSYDQAQNRPNSRMVVLRSFYPDWTFRFFTDNRSDKIRELQKCRFASALFWDPAESLQIRIQAKAVIHHNNEISENEWHSVHRDAKKAYTPVLPPGAPITQPAEAHQWPEEYHNNYFTVVDLIPSTIQVLQLNGLDHLSARFQKAGPGNTWTGGWIAP